MNWYIKQLFEEGRWFTKEEFKGAISLILNEEMNEQEIQDPKKRKSITSKIIDIFSTFPDGSLIKREGNEWSVADPDKHILSLNEPSLQHSIPGGAARFDFMRN